ncbi:MAG: type VI secretion system ATPase TssH, partial [Acidobacteria bacterium]|nr:type VI secretion system ATPase TssH [Acidobacteriota bacterium]
EIVDIQLERLVRRLADRRIELRLSGEAKQYLAGRGFDPVYGARPLKRAIQRDLETPLSRSIVAGEIRDDTVVEVGVGEHGLKFESVPRDAKSGNASA